MNIAICDDSKEDALVIYRHLKRYYDEHQLPFPQVFHVTNGTDLRKIGQMDLLFLDIELQVESGIELAAEINLTYPNTIVVFVSSYPFYVTDAYHVQAAQFFVKPLQYEIFQREYDRLLKRYHTIQDHFTRKIVSFGEIELHKSDIVYIEAFKRVLVAHTTTKKSYEYYGKIGEEEQFLNGTTIIRCHRGYLVNLAHVLSVNRNGILVQFADGSTSDLPVSESLYNVVRQEFMQYIIRY